MYWVTREVLSWLWCFLFFIFTHSVLICSHNVRAMMSLALVKSIELVINSYLREKNEEMKANRQPEGGKQVMVKLITITILTFARATITTTILTPPLYPPWFRIE